MSILSVIFKSASKALKGGYSQTRWQVKELETQKMWYSHDYLMKLTMQAKNNKDTESLVTIFKYLKQFEPMIERSNLVNYKKIFKIIRENVKISDLL